MKQRIIISDNLEAQLSEAVALLEHDKIFILTDTTTTKLCLPVIKDYPFLAGAQHIEIPAGDTAKNIDSLMHVWQSLSDGGATRHSLMINLGGGMITDLGGFAASSFKRGIKFINIPTTLLSMVDASVGGKTGINLGGLKNEVGTFCDSDFVILDSCFLATLDHDNILSGYAEMLKHGLINPNTEDMLIELLNYDIENPDLKVLNRMVADSVKVKEYVVSVDPHEHGMRKALNLGHTAGHAFETFAMRANRPLLHGYAVAYGLIVELYLSTKKKGFSADRLHQLVAFINAHYGRYLADGTGAPFTCDDYPALFELMTHDKKNVAGIINFTLLRFVGGLALNETATREEIYEALDFCRES